MTFILNVLHKDHSLMVSDTLGNAAGPLKLTAGPLTMEVPSGGLVEGMRKTFLSANKRFALGYAGTTDAHGYIDTFKECSAPEEAMRCVRGHIESHFDFDCRDDLLDGKGLQENSLILSFFDAEKAAFFSGIYGFSRLSSWNNIYARRTATAPILLHVGSGSSFFEKAVGLDAINDFVLDIEKGLEIEGQLQWIAEAYEKVSLVAPGCGAQFEAAIATRDKPEFRFIREASGVTVKPHRVSAQK